MSCATVVEPDSYVYNRCLLAATAAVIVYERYRHPFMIAENSTTLGKLRNKVWSIHQACSLNSVRIVATWLARTIDTHVLAPSPGPRNQGSRWWKSLAA